MKQSSISLSGRIDKNYQVPPNSRIVLEHGAVFNGEDVGGQILYNNSDKSVSFIINDGELELTNKILFIRTTELTPPSKEDFLSAVVPLSKFVQGDVEEASLTGDSSECTLHVPLIFAS